VATNAHAAAVGFTCAGSRHSVCLLLEERERPLSATALGGIAMNSESGWLSVLAGGRVRCARRGEEVELARCLECNWLQDLDRAASTPAVRCTAASPVPDGRHARSTDGHVD
jgi:hypothetical protein